MNGIKEHCVTCTNVRLINVLFLTFLTKKFNFFCFMSEEKTLDSVDSLFDEIINSPVEVQKLYDSDPSFISEKDELFPSYFGGPVLKKSPNSTKLFHFYNNAGRQVGPPISFENSSNVYLVYIFPDSTVGFSVTPNEGFIVDTIKINGEEVDPLTRSFKAVKPVSS